MKALMVVATCLAATASAQGARLAVHPLELRELSASQRERLQARFDVMLARISDIRLAASAAVDEALLLPQARDCETRDEGLRFLADATESLYGLYVRVRPDPLGTRLLVAARVVRSDGAVVRKLSLSAPLSPEVELTLAARPLLAQLLEQLDLVALEATLPATPVARANGPTLSVPSGTPVSPVRRPVGLAMLGVGATTLVAGAIVAGFAVNGSSKLNLDPRQPAALEVAREGQAAAVLIPVGAVVAAIGAALAWWPAGRPVSVAVLASNAGAGLQVQGCF